MIASGYAVGNPTSGIFNHTWTVGYASSGSIFVRNIDTNVTATLPVSFNGDASIPVMLDPGQKVFIQFTGITSVPASLNTVVTASAPISYDYIALSSRLQNGNVVSLLSLITDADLKANIQHALLDHTHPERVISAALTLYSYSFNV